jgi:hypothetical protein
MPQQAPPHPQQPLRPHTDQHLQLPAHVAGYGLDFAAAVESRQG